MSQASLFIAQPSTASGSLNPSISGNHISGHVASAIHTGFLQASQNFQDHAQTLAFQGHSNDASPSLRPLTIVFIGDWHSCTGPASMFSPATTTAGSYHYWTAQGSPAQCHRQHPLQQNWVTNLLALGTLPLYSVQTATSTPSIVTDIPNMDKVIPNIPLKLQQKIIQGEFMDLSEVLQADFQFKYASIEANNAFQLVCKDKTVLMWPRKKGKQIDSLGMWLSKWALYEQVMVYVYPQKYSVPIIGTLSCSKTRNSFGLQSRCMALGSGQCGLITAVPSPPWTKP